MRLSKLAYGAVVAVLAVGFLGYLATHRPRDMPRVVAVAPSPVTPAPRAPSPATPAPAEQGAAGAPHVQVAGAPRQTTQLAQVPRVASTSTASGAAAGDPAAGRDVYRKCQACHSLEAGRNLVGPHLGGIIGRKAGSEPGFNFSPALKQSNIVWDAATLDAYLTDPQKVVPRNRMPFPGLKTEQNRKDVIAFLTNPAAASAPSAQAAAPVPATRPSASGDVHYVSEVKYTLRSGIAEGKMVYLGVGGAIDGQVNPRLTAIEGQSVQVTLINGEGAEHDIVFPDQETRSPRVSGRGASTTVAFRAGKAGEFIYFCSTPGHQLAGMQGQLSVAAGPAPPAVAQADLSRPANDLPPPIGKRAPQTVRVELTAIEQEGRLADDTTFGFWTFNGKVPGPFLRVRVGDTVDVVMKNAPDSGMIHSVDFHAATGPGGGAASTQVDPGGEKAVKFKALTPELYVYHCATPMVAHHIANGMYGLILVEPEEGLPPVDHEFYVMQGEIYTDAAYGKHGSQEFSVEKLLNERPEYFVFNGSVGAISQLHPLKAKVGEKVRIFFGVGGPNFTSSFHVIGEIFDKVYMLGGATTPPVEGIQTVTVPAGGAVIVEFKLDVPGNYVLVDHALARMERGLVGILAVEGPPNPEIYDGVVTPGMGH